MIVFKRYLSNSKWAGLVVLLGGVAVTKFGTVQIDINKRHNDAVQAA